MLLFWIPRCLDFRALEGLCACARSSQVARCVIAPLAAPRNAILCGGHFFRPGGGDAFDHGGGGGATAGVSYVMDILIGVQPKTRCHDDASDAFLLKGVDMSLKFPSDGENNSWKKGSEMIHSFSTRFKKRHINL